MSDEFITTRYIETEAPKANKNLVEVVRCVECRYKGMEICPMYKLTKAGVLKPYDFCSYGCRDSEKPNNSEIPTGSERSSE